MATVSVENIFKLENVLSIASKSIFAMGSIISKRFHSPAPPPHFAQDASQVFGPVIWDSSSSGPTSPPSVCYDMENINSWENMKIQNHIYNMMSMLFKKKKN